MSSLKKIHQGDPENSRFVTGAFLALFITVTLVFVKLLWVYVSAVVLALVLASLFSGVHRFFARRYKNRVLTALVCTVIVSTSVILPVALFGVAVSVQAVDVYQDITEGRAVTELIKEERTKSRGERFVIAQAKRLGLEITPEEVQSAFAESVSAIGNWLYGNAGSIAQNTAGALMDFSMMIIALFAFFAEGDRLRDYVLDLSPLPDEQEMMFVTRFQAISRAVFVGNGIASGIQGVFAGASFYIFGLGNGILWGAVTAFFAFLPIVGASVVVIPAAIYLFLKGEPLTALLFVGFNGVQIAFFEYGLKTRLIGGKANANGVLVFFGIVAGLSMFGILGLFYGPLILTMFLTVSEIYKKHYRVDLMNVHSPWAHADAHAQAALQTPKTQKRSDDDVPLTRANAPRERISELVGRILEQDHQDSDADPGISEQSEAVQDEPDVEDVEQK